MKTSHLIMLAVVGVIVLLSVAVKPIKNYTLTPRKESGIYLREENKTFEYESNPGFHGDGYDYAIYTFNDKEIEEIVETIKKEQKWGEVPLDLVTIKLLKDWNGLIKNNIEAQEALSKSKYSEFVPRIKNGYYLLMDRSTYKSNKSPAERIPSNFSIYLLDLTTKTIYFYNLDT